MNAPEQALPNAPATPDQLAALYLRHRDTPCPACGYNRRDGATAACPECGEAIPIGPTKWSMALDTDRKSAIKAGWFLLILQLGLWCNGTVMAWERIGLIRMDAFPKSRINYLVLALHTPSVVLLPIAVWYTCKIIRNNSKMRHLRQTERAGLFSQSLAYTTLGAGPWLIFFTVWWISASRS